MALRAERDSPAFPSEMLREAQAGNRGQKRGGPNEICHDVGGVWGNDRTLCSVRFERFQSRFPGRRSNHLIPAVTRENALLQRRARISPKENLQSRGNRDCP